MNRLILLSTCALGACSFSNEVPEPPLPEVFVGFQEAASTADEKSKMFPVNVQLSDITTVDVTVKYQIEPGPGVDAGDRPLAINLRDDCALGRHERVLEVVAADPAERDGSRARWREYQARGYTLEKHDM